MFWIILFTFRVEWTFNIPGHLGFVLELRLTLQGHSMKWKFALNKSVRQMKCYTSKSVTFDSTLHD